MFVKIAMILVMFKSGQVMLFLSLSNREDEQNASEKGEKAHYESFQNEMAEKNEK